MRLFQSRPRHCSP
jgi:hypothetical protein